MNGGDGYGRPGSWINLPILRLRPCSGAHDIPRYKGALREKQKRKKRGGKEVKMQVLSNRVTQVPLFDMSKGGIRSEG